jgi:Zn-dependent peptidase ImmA (M78 family)
MPLELTTFADKLRRYRAQFDLLAAHEGQDERQLGRRIATRGARQPTGDEVLVLADYFKCDFRFFISNEQLAPFEKTEKLFRKFGDELSSADRWAIQELLYLCECEAFLDVILERSRTTTFTFLKHGTYFKRHGEEAAEQLRRHLRYQPNEIPIDIFADFRHIGIHVFRRKLDNSNISGLYLKHPTAGKCVLVNYAEDVYRQRFSVAHEAGHSILDDDEDFVVTFVKWNYSDLVEIRANTFAAHFLLPPEYVKQMPGSNWNESTIIAEAQRLHVNVETLVIALERESRIGEDTARRLKTTRVPVTVKSDPELSSSLSPGARALKLDLLRRGLSTYYVRLCFDAYDRGLVSAARVAEMMLTDDRNLLDIGSLYGWTPKHGA